MRPEEANKLARALLQLPPTGTATIEDPLLTDDVPALLQIYVAHLGYLVRAGVLSKAHEAKMPPQSYPVDDVQRELTKRWTTELDQLYRQLDEKIEAAESARFAVEDAMARVATKQLEAARNAD